MNALELVAVIVAFIVGVPVAFAVVAGIVDLWIMVFDLVRAVPSLIAHEIEMRRFRKALREWERARKVQP